MNSVTVTAYISAWMRQICTFLYHLVLKNPRWDGNWKHEFRLINILQDMSDSSVTKSTVDFSDSQGITVYRSLHMQSICTKCTRWLPSKPIVFTATFNNCSQIPIKFGMHLFRWIFNIDVFWNWNSSLNVTCAHTHTHLLIMFWPR